MSAHDMPTEEATRRPMNPMGAMNRKPRPFAPVDNPTLSPSYDDAGSLSPSPVPDWSLVREDPSDQPEYAPRGRNPRAGAVVAPRIFGLSVPMSAPASVPCSAPAAGPSSDLQDLDSLLLENSGGLQNEHSTRSRDWADEYDNGPAVAPKKRRVERLICDDDIEEVLDFPMEMPLELDLDHAHVECHPEPHDMHMEMHHDFMHPEMAFSYQEEEEIHLQPMPMPMPMPRGARMMHPHARMHHPQEYVHEMEMYTPMEPEAVSPRRSPQGRSPAASPATSPAQMQPRRMVTMARHPRSPAMYGGRYMNAYVPSVAVPVGGGPYYRRAYARAQPYRYVNPANLPSSRVRKAYHLSPMTPERRVTHAPAYFMNPEEEAFHHRHHYFPEEEAAEFGMMEERSPTSVAAIDMPHHQRSVTARGRPAPLKRMSLPAMKVSCPSPAKSAPPSPPVEDRKPSPTLSPSPAASAPSVSSSPVNEEDCTQLVHFSKREHVSLAIDEDANWLSEFQSYVRLEFLEIFRASHEDVKFRNTSRKVALKQLGIRCRFCAHIHPGSRARRSSAYPSSTAQIYQSFNMMIRDHFPRCEHVPKESMDMFHKLKGRNNQGAADSKHFWSYAAEKLGMADSESGIFMDDATQQAARTKLPFSTTDGIMKAARTSPVLLLTGEDRTLVSPFLYELLSRVQRVNLLDCECRSTRKNLKVGLPGFGCRYCFQAGRLGFSRIFPTKRKGLPEKANDMYEHMRRCPLCPAEVKKRLESLRPKPEEVNAATEKVFFDRFWARLNAGESP